MCAESFSFFQTRFDILLVAFLVSLLLTSLLAAAPLYGYYTYMLPMTDHEVEYVVADFHNHPIGTGAAFGAMSNVTLLEDRSVDVDFAPSPRDVYFQTVPHFEYSRNIKVGQTFAVGCTDYEIELKVLKQEMDAAKQRIEESKQEMDAAKQKSEESELRFEFAQQWLEELKQDLEFDEQWLEELKQDLEELKQSPNTTYVNMLKYAGVKSLEKNPAYEFPSDHFRDRYFEDVERLNGTSTLEFFHFGALLSGHMPCNYPDVIEWSIDVIQTDGREDREWFIRSVWRD